MKILVVYESMYGNTHLVADAIAKGIREVESDVTVLPVDEADADALAGTGLLVIGGPTHAHGMTRPSTRNAAVQAARKPGSDLELDPDAEGPGSGSGSTPGASSPRTPRRSTPASRRRRCSPAGRPRASPAASTAAAATSSWSPRASS
jgi:hypothetical protein